LVKADAPERKLQSHRLTSAFVFPDHLYSEAGHMGSKPNSKPWWRWQFGLQAVVMMFTLLGIFFAYASHFHRLTQQAQSHREERQRRENWSDQMLRVSFHMPQQYWNANEADHQWHAAKEKECLVARWLPWDEVDENDIPPLTQKEEPWPDWTTEWRSTQK
jgi:hypothetical protein